MLYYFFVKLLSSKFEIYKYRVFTINDEIFARGYVKKYNQKKCFD